jgi:lysophospholipase L1-like esterase
MPFSRGTRCFTRHPALTLGVIVLALSLILDLGLTTLYRLAKHGTIHFRAGHRSTIRVPSAVFHNGLKPNALSEAEGWGPLHPTLYTNSLGFKDSAIRTVLLAPDHSRILFMGDSFTEGVGYDYPQTFVGLIDEALRPKGIEVLNAAVVGYFPAIYYRKTQHLLDTIGLRFDLMVLCLDVSDPIDEVKGVEIRDGETVLTPKRDSPVLEFLSAYSTIPRHLIKALSLLGQMVREPDFRLTRPIARTAEDERYGTGQERSLWTIDQELLDAYGRRGLARAERHMNLLHALLSRHRIPLVLVIYPWPDQIAHRDLDSIHARFWQRWALARSVPVINLFPDFIRGDQRPLDVVAEFFIQGDTHWNEKGHRLVARRLLQELSPLLPMSR